MVDDKAKSVTLMGESVNLTPKGCVILKFLMENPKRVFPPKQIYENVWDEFDFGTIVVMTANFIKASIGNVKFDIAPCNVGLLISQTMAEYKEKADISRRSWFIDCQKPGRTAERQLWHKYRQ